ncbi:chromosome segregation ATPase [Oxalobacteraceae bacterium GrIS 1.11]
MYNYMTRITLSYFMEGFMARTGILYSHVLKAAEKVLAEGSNPTVDSVRVALGGTGSKSTIAPLLKRWKAEHQEVVMEAESGVPADLLLAVKAVYDKLQADARAQLEQARDLDLAVLQAADARLRLAEEEKTALAHAKSTLAIELALRGDVLAHAQGELQAGAVTLAALGSDNAGLRERLADRVAENAALHQQLAQARSQFEHYQEAGAIQRAEERQAAEQRAARLEQEFAGAQQRLLRQQSSLSQQELQIAQLEQENRRLRDAELANLAELAALRPERDQLAYQFKEAAAAAQALAAKLEARQDALGEARIGLATQQQRAELLNSHLARAEDQERAHAQERLALIEEKATLQARLDHLQRRTGK